ncbi:TetR/AcrR family transcriptional regulator [Paenibacillus filicis]|uniref:TetR/AcrR family transcriptional regulator n=1 Tax=Paenibacillus filicis TaxID=669464 RepID=A0ABU9DW01_9BACL
MGTEIKTDRRILRTREAINRAFLELFSAKELEHITINDIAERANVNRGTIYLHYSDKYDLLDKCIDEHLSKLITFCSHQGTESLVSSDLKPVFVYFEEHFLFFSAMLSNQRTFSFRERLLHFVSANLRDKLDNLDDLDKQNPQRGIDKELNTQFMASAFLGIVEWWIRHRMPHSPEFMADQVRKLFEKNEVYPGHA